MPSRHRRGAFYQKVERNGWLPPQEGWCQANGTTSYLCFLCLSEWPASPTHEESFWLSDALCLSKHLHSGMGALPLASCLCQCTASDSASSSGQCSHSARAAPARGDGLLPHLTLCRDCLCLNPGGFPCAMLSGSKTLWAACHLIRLITIVVLDFT